MNYIGLVDVPTVYDHVPLHTVICISRGRNNIIERRLVESSIVGKPAGLWKV